MPKKRKQVSANALAKKMTSDEVRVWLQDARIVLEPDYVLNQVSDMLAKGITPNETTDKEETSIFNNAAYILGHERHYLVAESVVDERWRSMVIDLAQLIQKEYACTSISEIALAGLAANAYYRSLRAARKMNAIIEKTEIGTVGAQLIAHTSKEIDRANRQYLAAIETLRSRRQPQLNVKVQTKAAFFGENQTFNANPQEPYENNDPQ